MDIIYKLIVEMVNKVNLLSTHGTCNFAEDKLLWRNGVHNSKVMS